jgi:hypothetical protein
MANIKSNTGNSSTGYRSTGYRSTGDFSTGGWSTGHYSTGHYSTGHYSTGHRSRGNKSTGDWSISNYSTGHFSTEDYSGFGAFDKPCTVEEWGAVYKPDWIYFSLTEWVDKEDMSDKEKEDNPSYKTTGGYLRVYGYQEAWRKAYDSATREEQLKIKDLPNFDKDKFKQISGIDIDEDTTNTIEIGGKTYEVSDELRSALKDLKEV